MLTTFTSYDTVSREHQAEIIRNIGAKADSDGLDEAVYRALKKALKDTGFRPSAE